MLITRSRRTFKALETEPKMLLEPRGEPNVAKLMRMMMEDKRHWEMDLAKREAK